MHLHRTHTTGMDSERPDQVTAAIAPSAVHRLFCDGAPKLRRTKERKCHSSGNVARQLGATRDHVIVGDAIGLACAGRRAE